METLDIDKIALENKEDNFKLQLHTGISEKDRINIASGLSKLLADSYLLMIKTHCYHWNVRGDLFYTIHEMTEEQYTDLFSAIDDLAERIRALGFDAPGTIEDFSKLSFIKDAKNKAVEKEIIADLLQSHESIVRNIRPVLETAEEAHDDVTVDMLTDRLTIHEKNAWMWRSFLER